MLSARDRQGEIIHSSKIFSFPYTPEKKCLAPNRAEAISFHKITIFSFDLNKESSKTAKAKTKATKAKTTTTAKTATTETTATTTTLPTVKLKRNLAVISHRN